MVTFSVEPKRQLKRDGWLLFRGCGARPRRVRALAGAARNAAASNRAKYWIGWHGGLFLNAWVQKPLK